MKFGPFRQQSIQFHKTHMYETSKHTLQTLKTLFFSILQTFDGNINRENKVSYVDNLFPF